MFVKILGTIAFAMIAGWHFFVMKCLMESYEEREITNTRLNHLLREMSQDRADQQEFFTVLENKLRELCDKKDQESVRVGKKKTVPPPPQNDISDKEEYWKKVGERLQRQLGPRWFSND